jgi:hypothetical protein
METSDPRQDGTSRANQFIAWLRENAERIESSERGALTFYYSGTSWTWEVKEKGEG